MFLALLLLQSFHVLFLALHDWVQMGRWNDIEAVRRANPGRRLLRSTAISTLPYAFGLAVSVYAVGRRAPGWLDGWLWGSYGLLFAGELRAWWVPYAFGADAERTARYRAMFGRTASFLPERHGIRPDALHVVLHLATVATLCLLAGGAGAR